MAAFKGNWESSYLSEYIYIAVGRTFEPLSFCFMIVAKDF
jgi:hypothetical protein